jgi:CheY-like chemotaxis protein/two-component sensor histidine kinase
VSLALDGLSQASPGRPLLEASIHAAQRAAGLTSQLLAYAGKGRLVIERLRPAKLVEQIGDLVRASIPKHVALEVDVGDDLPLVEGDARQLQQVLMNLALNGAEAVPERTQGRVQVTGEAVTLTAAEIAAQYGQELPGGEYVLLAVSDNGSGMDAYTQARMFDPFFTTKFTGRGLGLAAVLGIVRSHKGAIRVESAPDAGTTFRVILPVVRPAPRVRGAILLTGAEDGACRSSKASLQRYGYEVLEAAGAREAIEICSREFPRVEAVLLDVSMSGMDGAGTLAELQAVNRDVKAILCGGASEAEMCGRFAGLRVAGFLQKPYTARTLAAKVDEILRE